MKYTLVAIATGGEVGTMVESANSLVEKMTQFMEPVNMN